MKSIRQNNPWPNKIEGLEIGGTARRDTERWDYGMVMNGGRVLEVDEIGDHTLSHYCIRSSNELKHWFVKLHKAHFWKKFPYTFANAGSPECVNKEFIRYAYEKYPPT